MLQKPFIAANDRLSGKTWPDSPSGRVISTAKGVTTPGIHLFVDRVQDPCPAYSIPLFTTHLRKEFLMYPKEKSSGGSRCFRAHKWAKSCSCSILPPNVLAGKVFRTFFLTKAWFSTPRSLSKTF